ncbi:hypothetical protein R3P38DRAFT_2792199 [Favolaschia claudopus]|uniref:Uncharacterized protein n=1 Tax=Favolaschia claudopus TaxID=2862362 RepID=A0AAW0AFI5_9AGAR
MPQVQAVAAVSARVPPQSWVIQNFGGRSSLFVSHLHRRFAFRWFLGLGGLRRRLWAIGQKFEIEGEDRGHAASICQNELLGYDKLFLGGLGGNWAAETVQGVLIQKTLCPFSLALPHSLLPRMPRQRSIPRIDAFATSEFSGRRVGILADFGDEIRWERFKLSGTRFRGVELRGFCAWEGQGNRGGGSGVTAAVVDVGVGLGGCSWAAGWLVELTVLLPYTTPVWFTSNTSNSHQLTQLCVVKCATHTHTNCVHGTMPWLPREVQEPKKGYHAIDATAQKDLGLGGVTMPWVPRLEKT